MGTDGSKPERDGALSPPLSVVSDAEVPYVSSFSTERPIGESPRRQFLSRGRTASASSAKATARPAPSRPSQRPSSLIVVSEGRKDDADEDDDLQRFQRLPEFLPIIKGVLNQGTFVSGPTSSVMGTSTKDPEILEKLDAHALKFLCLRFQDFLRTNAQVVAEEQARLEAKMKEIDTHLSKSVSMLSQRQRRFAKVAEELSHVHELSRTFRKCQIIEEDILRLAEELNQLLHEDERLPAPVPHLHVQQPPE